MESIIILLSLYLITFLFALLRETTFSMVFSLIVVFLIACLLVFNLNFYFLGFMILFIYIGAIAVLFLFMVMLFDRAEYKIFKFESSTNKNFSLILLLLIFSFFIGSSFFVYINLHPNVLTFSCFTRQDVAELKDLILFLNIPNRVDNILLFFGSNETYETFNLYSIYSDAELIGFKLYIKYFFLLLVSGLGLLIAMIGCILITKSSFLEKFDRRTQRIEKQLSRFKI